MPGNILGVRVSCPRTELATLRPLILDLSKRNPDCPVVVFLDMTPEEGVSTAGRLSSSRFRAVVPLGSQTYDILRDILTDRSVLARDVVDWLHLHSLRLNPNQADLLEKVFAAASLHRDVAGVLGHFRISQSSARFRLRKRGLPAPGRWLHVARALHAALHLQARPGVPVSVVAGELGFADHSALVHLFQRSFGVSVREIRNTLGWEWLLHRWLISSVTQLR